MNTKVLDRLWLLMAFGALIAAAFLTMGRAHADPYCGSGNNYDARHNICQPGAPQWNGGGGLPYPLPGDEGPGGRSPGPYGGSYGGN